MSATRVEIMVGDALVTPLTELLDRHAPAAYVVVEGLSGVNRRGVSSPGLADALVVVVCRSATSKALLDNLKAFLSRYGGVAFATDGFGVNVD
ncbi:hypothetical protein [Phreatobacter oligotrophus]|uniref:Nitrogen regulatory protein P-II family n=1 Tax=Phreatobacter oligotrophus TaxID=1122261 RepID=A0A2T4YS51_9HYPH|nr:hypothetical protein [Phreatobacter oligotrophus]PTM46621.1 hypothetical protein C8P69_1292 [Phreatobacter oligotrophus]